MNTKILFPFIGVFLLSVTGVGASVLAVKHEELAQRFPEAAAVVTKTTHLFSGDDLRRNNSEVEDSTPHNSSASASARTDSRVELEDHEDSGLRRESEIRDDSRGERRSSDDSDEWEDEDEDEDEDRGHDRGGTVSGTVQTSGSVAPVPVSVQTPAKTFTLAQVATHNSTVSCYTAIGGSVYDVTSFVTRHPGGQSAIKSLCGVDGSVAFSNQHGGQGSPARELASFKVGALVQ